MNELETIPDAPTAVLPMTDAQREVRMVERSTGNPHLYTILAELSIDPVHSPGVLAEAVRAVLAVQPALRLALSDVPAPRAVLAEPAPDDPPVHRTRWITPDEFERVREQELARLSGAVFDLAEPPHLRTVALHVADRSRTTLLLVTHHSVFDGYSVGVLARDLGAALTGALDVAVKQRDREAALRAELVEQLRVSREDATGEAAARLGDRVRDVPPTTLYPRPSRPVDTDFSGGRAEFALGTEISRAVDNACLRLGISPFAFFAAAHALTLARHTGNTSVLFGATVMTRRTPAAHELCGFFVNTVPMRVDVSWRDSFADFIDRVVGPEAERTAGSGAVPLNQVVRAARPERASSRNPLLSTLLTMQEPLTFSPAAPVREACQHGTGTAKFDLLLWATPGTGGWRLDVEHDLQLVPAPIVAAYAESLTGLLERAARNPDSPVTELFSDGPVHIGTERTATREDLLRQVLSTADEHPGEIAVRYRDERLSYAELARDARRAAAGLAERGVGPGDIVGLTASSLPEIAVAVLAVLARRAAYLPLDPELPATRLAAMVRRADCRLVVGDAAVAGLPPVPVRELLTAAAPDGTARDGRTLHDAVYAMFTSGSTGEPKGVLMGGTTLSNLTNWQINALRMDRRTKFLQYAPMGFDVSFQELLPTLVAGGTVVSRAPVDRRDLPALAHHSHTTGVTHVYLPAAALRGFVLAADAAGLPLDRLTHLCVAGEQLVVDDAVRSFFAARPHARLVNMYGPTETHVTTAEFFDPGGEPWPSHAPIGRPLPGVSAQIVDASGHLAPVGVPGELLLGGTAPAHGYLNAPELTAQRFVADPHSPASAGPGPGPRRYRTGDQVLLNTDGALVHLGRDDDQVKIRGHRVELGELESAAGGISGVRRAVAAVAGADTGLPDRRLLLFVVPDREEADQDALPAAVRSALRSALPSHMVPSVVLLCDSVPTSHNGKIDRAALVRRAGTGALTGTATAAPVCEDEHSPLITELTLLWEPLLGARVPAGESLVEHGAHSLLVVTALGMVEQRYGVAVPVLDFFRLPTIAALAELVEAARTGAEQERP